MRRLAGDPRVEVGSGAGPGDNLSCVVGAQLLQLLEYSGQHHVAVVNLAEDVLRLAGPAARYIGRPAEAETGDLEHVSEPLRGDPHVVLRLLPLWLQRLRGEREKLIE